MGDAFTKQGVAFDVALVSPARRSAETFALVRGRWPAPLEVRPEPRLYGASVGDLLAIIADSPPAAKSLLLVGHNPGLHELAVQLVGDDPGAAGLHTKLPTGTLVEIRLDCGNWKQAASAHCRLLRLLRPRELD
jgi:phosphohistidine phosphatase